MASQPKERGRFGRVIEQYLSGGRNSDPLYLSNRSWKRHFLTGFRFLVPLLILFGAAGWYLMSRLVPKPPPKYDLTPAEILSKLKLPDLNNLKVDSKRDLEVVEVGIQRGASTVLAGSVRNVSSHAIASAEVDIDLSDLSGSRLSTETVRFQDVAPSAEPQFRVPIADAKAQLAIVRAIRTK